MKNSRLSEQRLTDIGNEAQREKPPVTLPRLQFLDKPLPAAMTMTVAGRTKASAANRVGT